MRVLAVGGILCAVIVGTAAAQYSTADADIGAAGPSTEAQMISEYLRGGVRANVEHARMIDAELAEIRATSEADVTWRATRVTFNPPFVWSELLLKTATAEDLDRVTKAICRYCRVTATGSTELVLGWATLKFKEVVNPAALCKLVGSMPHVLGVGCNWIGHTPEALHHAGLYPLEEAGQRTYVFVVEHSVGELGSSMEWLCYQARAGVIRYVGYWDQSQGGERPAWKDLVEAAWGFPGAG